MGSVGFGVGALDVTYKQKRRGGTLPVHKILNSTPQDMQFMTAKAFKVILYLAPKPW
jgi:hypothetical protein